jgi:hypothetical protein
MNDGEHFGATIAMLERDHALLVAQDSPSSAHRLARLEGGDIQRCVCVCVGLDFFNTYTWCVVCCYFSCCSDSDVCAVHLCVSQIQIRVFLQRAGFVGFTCGCHSTYAQHQN